MANENTQAAPQTTDVPDSPTDAAQPTSRDVDDIEATLRFAPDFDAFGGEEDPPAPETTPDAAVTQPQQPVPGTPTDQPVEQAQATSELDTLRAQLAQQQALTAQLIASQQQRPQPQAQQQQAGAEAPQFNFDIPAQLVEMLGSGDPVKMREAMTAFARGIATGMHRQSVMPTQTVMSQHVQQMVSNAIQSERTQNAIFSDFYGAHPDLHRPEIFPLIASVAQQLHTEMGGQIQWGSQFRDALAARVRATLGQQPVAVQPTPTPQTQQPFVAPTTARPGGAGEQDSKANEILDTLFGQ